MSEGLYLSARDFGNYFAGYVAAMTNQTKLKFLKIAGALNHFKNDKVGLTIEMATGFYRAKSKYPTCGELFESNFFQRLGFHKITNLHEFYNLGTSLWID